LCLSCRKMNLHKPQTKEILPRYVSTCKAIRFFRGKITVTVTVTVTISIIVTVTVTLVVMTSSLRQPQSQSCLQVMVTVTVMFPSHGHSHSHVSKSQSQSQFQTAYINFSMIAHHRLTDHVRFIKSMIYWSLLKNQKLYLFVFCENIKT
jgi:hypothetical protein